MFFEDDSDVKIFGENKNNNLNKNEEKSLIFEIEKHQNNGNMARAKKLGQMLADELLPADSISQFGFANGIGYPNETIEVSFQRRVLMAFCVEVGLEMYIDNDVLSSAAIAEFHKRMEKEYPDFYKSIMDLGAFSLYYLGLRTEGKAEKAIGSVFARLCRDSDKGLYADFGEALFIYFMDSISKMVSEQGFKGLNCNEGNENNALEMEVIEQKS